MDSVDWDLEELETSALAGRNDTATLETSLEVHQKPGYAIPRSRPKSYENTAHTHLVPGCSDWIAHFHSEMLHTSIKLQEIGYINKYVTIKHCLPSTKFPICGGKRQ